MYPCVVLEFEDIGFYATPEKLAEDCSIKLAHANALKAWDAAAAGPTATAYPGAAAPQQGGFSALVESEVQAHLQRFNLTGQMEAWLQRYDEEMLSRRNWAPRLNRASADEAQRRNRSGHVGGGGGRCCRANDEVVVSSAESGRGPTRRGGDRGPGVYH